jgi:hypothetical protein
MLLHRHKLNGVVSSFVNARERVEGKLFVGTYPRSLLRHTDVRLVHKRSTLRNTEVRVFPYVRRFRSPHLGAEKLRVLILRYPPTERRDTLSGNFTTVLVPKHKELVVLAVSERILGQLKLPGAVVSPLKVVGTVNRP